MSIRADVTIKANNAAMKELEIKFIKSNYRYDILRSSCTADMDSYVIIKINYVRGYYFAELLRNIALENEDNKIKFQAIFVCENGETKEMNTDDDDDEFNTMYTETVVHYE